MTGRKAVSQSFVWESNLTTAWFPSPAGRLSLKAMAFSLFCWPGQFLNESEGCSQISVCCHPVNFLKCVNVRLLRYQDNILLRSPDSKSWLCIRFQSFCFWIPKSRSHPRLIKTECLWDCYLKIFPWVILMWGQG